MSLRYAKTDAGREEIRACTRKLSRSMRNLLLLIDERHTADHWLRAVGGVTADDLQRLLDEGLIRIHGDTGDVDVSHAELARALSHLNYEQLYTLLTKQARDNLGLIAGYKFVLEVEKASGVEELRALAQKFLQLIQKHHSVASAQVVRRAFLAAV